MSHIEMKPAGVQTQESRAASRSDADWQRLFIATLQTPWTSLAIVPADAGIPVDQLAETFVAMGQQHWTWPVRLLSAVGARPGDVQKLLDSVRAMTNGGDRVVIPVDPIAQNPAAMPIIGATSRVLFAVRIGESRLSSARKAVNAIGPERFLGSIVLG